MSINLITALILSIFMRQKIGDTRNCVSNFNLRYFVMVGSIIAALLLLIIPPCMLRYRYMLRVNDNYEGYNLIKTESLSVMLNTHHNIHFYLSLTFMFFYSIILIFWFDLVDKLLFYIVITFLSIYFLTYLKKESKYKRYFLTKYNRPWNDRLVITSSIYALASVYALTSKQYQFSMMCLMTSIGSTLYHLNNETMYFNLDNIFATSLLFIFIYTLVSSYYHHEIYFHMGVVGLPVSLFLLIHCGMPADIVINYCTEDKNRIKYCTRMKLVHYELLHNLWHLASGIGPFMVVWYMDYIKIQNIINVDGNDVASTAGSAQVYLISIGSMEQVILKYLHSTSIIISVLINVVSNYVGIMPID